MHRFPFAAALLTLIPLPAAAFAQWTPTDDAARAIAAARAAADAAELAARAARDAAEAAERASGGAPSTEQSAEPRIREDLPVPSNGRESRINAREVAASQAIRASLANSVANGPNDRLLRSSTSPELQLFASSTDKAATLSWTFDLSGAPTGRLSHTEFTATVTSALSDGEAQFLGLRGFPGGTEITANFTHYFSRFSPATSEREQVTVARENCRREKAGQTNIESLCHPYSYGGGLSRFVADYYPAGLEPMLRQAMPGNIMYLGGGFSANQTDFSYLDQPSFTMNSVSRFGFGGNVFGGVIFSPGQTAITASASYRRRYRAQDAITLCQQINAIPQTQCITAPGGPPRRSGQTILAVEFRHAFQPEVGELARVAIAPEFSVDLENESYSIDLPIYLITDTASRLRGGIRLGYLNSPREGGGRDDDFSLGLFVGVPFSVFR